MNLKLWFILLLNIAFGILGQILLKYALTLKSNSSFTSIASFIQLCIDWRFILAVLCYIVNLILYLFLLTKLNLGYIFPIQVSLAIVGVYLLSVFLFNEPFILRNTIAILLIVAGIAMMKN